MNIFITGEKGFIARNLIERSKNFKDFNIITGAVDYLNMHQKGEPCVYQNSIDQWQFFFCSHRFFFGLILEDGLKQRLVLF